jgi:hypothetical protein
MTQTVRDWVHANLEALGTLGPYLNTLVTILLALISYRAVVTGPRIQREISRDTIRMTRAQITAGLYGTADHQWIADFRQAIAEVFALSSNRFLTTRAGLAGPQHGLVGIEDRIKLSRDFSLLLAKIRLMVPQADGDELALLITDMTFGDELAKGGEDADRLVTKAKTLIEQREARLASYASLAS